MKSASSDLIPAFPEAQAPVQTLGVQARKDSRRFTFQLRRPQTLILIAVFMNLAQAAPLIAFPLIAKHLIGVSPALLGGYISAQGFIFVITAWLSGRLSDRFGRRVTIVSGFVAAAAGDVTGLLLQSPMLFFIPMMLIGMSMGLVWSTLDAALTDGQTPRQIKRALAFFNYSWVSASFAGALAMGALYKLSPALPQYIALLIIAGLLAMIFIPRSLEIAPWGREESFDHDNHVTPTRRRLFIHLAMWGNLVMFLTLACYRGLLPEFVDVPGMSVEGWRFGLLSGAIFVGVVPTTALLMAWHRWHYSLRFLIGAETGAALLLILMTLSRNYPLLVGLATLFGFCLGMTYNSAFFYGMSNRDDKGAHGGDFEALNGLGCALGPLLGGWAIALTHGLGVGFSSRAHLLVCASLCLMVIAVQLALVRKSLGRRAVPPAHAIGQKA